MEGKKAKAVMKPSKKEKRTLAEKQREMEAKKTAAQLEKDAEGASPTAKQVGEVFADKLVEATKAEHDRIHPLKIRCAGASTMPLASLHNFQKKFKELRPEEEEKLAKQIIEHGMIAPVTVWDHKGVTLLLDGHQRIELLKKMVKAKRIRVDDEIPVSMGHPENLEEARRFVLALASTYGRVNRKGLKEFMVGSKLSDHDLQTRFSFPDLELEDFKRKVAEEDKEKSEKKHNTKNEQTGKTLRVKCPKCETVFDYEA